jgi:hypothetical protein
VTESVIGILNELLMRLEENNFMRTTGQYCASYNDLGVA